MKLGIKRPDGWWSYPMHLPKLETGRDSYITFLTAG